MGVKNTLISCLADAGNTGFGDCVTDIGTPIALLFTGKNQTFTTADITTLMSDIQAALLADDNSQRVFPVNGLIVLADNTGDPVTQTFNDGSITVVRDAPYNLTLQWNDGKFCLLYQLLKLRGTNKPFFIYTDKNLLIGTDAGTDLFRGVKPDFLYPRDFKFGNGNSAVAEYSLIAQFKSFQINAGIAFVDFTDYPSFISDLSGLQNVVVTQGAAPTATTIKVKLSTSCGTVDLYDEYSTELAVPGAWDVRDSSNNGVITVSAAVVNPTISGWTLTLTAAAGKTVKAGLVGPTELDALHVSGYESNQLIQVIPAS